MPAVSTHPMRFLAIFTFNTLMLEETPLPYILHSILTRLLRVNDGLAPVAAA